MAGSAGDANELVRGGQRSVVDLVMVLPPTTGRWERELKKKRARNARAEQVPWMTLATVVVVVVLLIATLSPRHAYVAFALCYVGLVLIRLSLDQTDRQERSVLIFDVLSETAGNLVEIALALDRDKRALRRRPSLCLAKVHTLLHQQYASQGDLPTMCVHRQVWKAARRLLRVRGITGSDEPEDAEAVKDFVEASLRLVLEAGRRHPVESSSALDWPGFEDLRWCLDYDARIAFYSSEADPHGADLCAERPPIVCWLDDGAPDEAMVLPQSEKFRAIAAPARNCACVDRESAQT